MSTKFVDVIVVNSLDHQYYSAHCVKQGCVELSRQSSWFKKTTDEIEDITGDPSEEEGERDTVT
jgi:hypothetical protein